VEDRQHFVQDACELYAVAELQRLAEDAGVAMTEDAADKLEAFEAYANERDLTSTDFDRWPNYMGNVATHLPAFFQDLTRVIGATPMDFMNVEREFRNRNLKGDFVIRRPGEKDISVSLKNYHQSAERPQCSSGTFNSFVLNFMFESSGVGMFIAPDGSRFKGSTKPKRDAAIEAAGFASVLPLMAQLDSLNSAIKERFVYSEEFEFLDERKFDRARKEVGSEGQRIILDIVSSIGAERIKQRLLKMTGLDGSEEILIMDPLRRSDSITNGSFRRLRIGVMDPESTVNFTAHGQSIRFEFRLDSVVLLTVDVPFTINKNGAWISEVYSGARLHKREGVMLSSGQRRPKKSKELATSTNTYVDFAAAGIF
jgi:hypothetical protein